ncbi:hypothetical protein [Bremerella alba]|uniref:Uncharacterized protein n=1 Tax=Bremerella alba TaxID=980252 RepID=A0A7V8V237_9BACT|nr:hypothetical protein [Bremerella alba]MBA2113530.1 hypothetical protein [Bremerella alba]
MNHPISQPSGLTRRTLLKQTLTFSAMFGLSESLFAQSPTLKQLPFEKINCEGNYDGHLQGVCADDEANLYWSFTTQLVKTSADGKTLQRIEVPTHHGDLCHHAGKIYVATNLGQFNKPAGQADSWIYVYDAQSLELLAKHPVQEAVHGAGGMEYRDGRFFVVGGLPADIEVNYVYEYSPEFKLLDKHVIESGQTYLGIQTAAFHDGHWWFGCYGKPNELLRTTADFQQPKRFPYFACYGIVPLTSGKFLIARGKNESAGQIGWLVPATADEKAGMKDVNS